MTTAGYADACRLRTEELLKIAEGIYDDGERAMIERAIGELEGLAVAAGSRSPAAGAPSDRARAGASARHAVAAAASLGTALPEIQKSWETGNARRVACSFAASGVLARQVGSVGGADIFISADSDWMDELERRGQIQRDTRVDLLGNRLVLVAPAASKLSIRIRPHFDLAGALGRGRLAVADTATVPAGKYAKAALTALGVWDSIADHLVQVENARVALACVARGDAALGIAYATCALAEPKVRIVDTFPGNSHPRIVYPAALTKDAAPRAGEFLNFLRGPEARAVFQKSGFIVLAA
jgi:molybdate transport system substrate-binding protein